jgi:DNA-binding Xre family transcriptional regulator
MKACYKKLWKLLIDKNLKRTDLKKLAGISSGSLAKLGKDENVSMDILQKLCQALECNIGDIMDLVPEDKDPEAKYE